MTPQIIDALKEDEEYVAVLFSGECSDEACLELRDGLESIDDEIAHIGIDLVQTSDVEYPLNVHGIEKLPALGIYRLVQLDSTLEIEAFCLLNFKSMSMGGLEQGAGSPCTSIYGAESTLTTLYRNGLFLLYEGPLEDEEELRRWLMDEDVLKIPGHVEEVNVPLLTYFYETDDDIVVFFYEVQ